MAPPFWKCIAVSQKTKNAFTIQPSNCTLWYLSHRKEMENYDHIKACPQMFTAALLVIAKTEIIQMTSTGEWLNKLWYLPAYHRILLSYKMEQTTDTCNNLDGSQGNYA